MNNKVVVNVLIIVIISLTILVGVDLNNNTQTMTAEMSLASESLKIAETIASEENVRIFDEEEFSQENDLEKQENDLEEFLNEKKQKSLEEEVVEDSEKNNNIKIAKKIEPITRGGHSRNKPVLKSDEEIAKEVYNGVYGNGEERKEILINLGYNYEEIQKEVDKLMANVNPSISNIPSKNSKVISAYPHSAFKSYMAWTALSKNSPQGKLCAKATKDNNTAIMMYEGRYLVALGKAYANYIGEKIDVVMENGQVIPVIVGDFKAIAHTDQYNSATLHDGSIIEFIVSSNKEASKAVQGSGSYNGIFPGKVKEFIKK